MSDAEVHRFFELINDPQCFAPKKRVLFDTLKATCDDIVKGQIPGIFEKHIPKRTMAIRSRIKGHGQALGAPQRRLDKIKLALCPNTHSNAVDSSKVDPLLQYKGKPLVIYCDARRQGQRYKAFNDLALNTVLELQRITGLFTLPPDGNYWPEEERCVVLYLPTPEGWEVYRDCGLDRNYESEIAPTIHGLVRPKWTKRRPGLQATPLAEPLGTGQPASTSYELTPTGVQLAQLAHNYKLDPSLTEMGARLRRLALSKTTPDLADGAAQSEGGIMLLCPTTKPES